MSSSPIAVSYLDAVSCAGGTSWDSLLGLYSSPSTETLSLDDPMESIGFKYHTALVTPMCIIPVQSSSLCAYK